MSSEPLPHGLASRDEAEHYLDWIAALFGSALTGRLLDHGAGTGALSARLLHRAEKVFALEPDARLCQLLAQRFASEPRVLVVPGTIETYLERFGGSSLDSLVSSNVLEHLADDVGCLRLLHAALAPGAALAVYVPARRELFGSLDASVGHVRRYSRTELRQKLISAGFEVEWVEYRNLAGVIPWLVAGRVLRKKALSDGNLRLFDRVVFPAFQVLERCFRLPYGLNVAALARRK